MSIDRFGDASEAHRRAVATRMADAFADARVDAYLEEKTSKDDNQKVATDVLVEWEKLDLVRAEGDEERESVRKELMTYVQALNTMHAMLDEVQERMVEQRNDAVFVRVAEGVGLADADSVLSPFQRLNEYTRRSLPNALVLNAEVAKLQLLAPDDTEEEIDEGGEIGDSDEESGSGSGSGSGGGSDDDIRSESEEEDDASEEEEPEAKRGRSE